MVSLLSSFLLKNDPTQRSPRAKHAINRLRIVSFVLTSHTVADQGSHDPSHLRCGKDQAGTRQVEKTYFYMCKYKCICVHTHNYMHMLLHIYVYMYIYVLIYMYVHICMYVYIKI